MDRRVGADVPHPDRQIGYIEELATSSGSLFAMRCRVCIDRYGKRPLLAYSMGFAGGVPVLDITMVVEQARVHYHALHRWNGPHVIPVYYADGSYGWL